MELNQFLKEPIRSNCQLLKIFCQSLVSVYLLKKAPTLSWSSHTLTIIKLNVVANFTEGLRHLWPFTFILSPLTASHRVTAVQAFIASARTYGSMAAHVT